MSSLTVKLWKSGKMIKFECKHDLQVFSWWMEQSEEPLIIFKFWPISHTQTLAEIFKLTNFEVCRHSQWSCESQLKWSNSNVKMIYKCFLDEWNRNRKFQSFSNFDLNRILALQETSWKFTNFEVCLHSL